MVWVALHWQVGVTLALGATAFSAFFGGEVSGKGGRPQSEYTGAGGRRGKTESCQVWQWQACEAREWQCGTRKARRVWRVVGTARRPNVRAEPEMSGSSVGKLSP